MPHPNSLSSSKSIFITSIHPMASSPFTLSHHLLLPYFSTLPTFLLLILPTLFQIQGKSITSCIILMCFFSFQFSLSYFFFIKTFNFLQELMVDQSESITARWLTISLRPLKLQPSFWITQLSIASDSSMRIPTSYELSLIPAFQYPLQSLMIKYPA